MTWATKIKRIIEPRHDADYYRGQIEIQQQAEQRMKDAQAAEAARVAEIARSAEAAPAEALATNFAQGPVSAPTNFEVSPQVVVYGPDGQTYGNPLIAERAGVQDYSMTRPDFLQNQNVLPELGYGYVGPGNAPANLQPINQAPALSPQQAMQFLGGQNPFIRPQEQGIGSLFRRLMQQ